MNVILNPLWTYSRDIKKLDACSDDTYAYLRQKKREACFRSYYIFVTRESRGNIHLSIGILILNRQPMFQSWRLTTKQPGSDIYAHLWQRKAQTCSTTGKSLEPERKPKTHRVVLLVFWADSWCAKAGGWWKKSRRLRREDIYSILKKEEGADIPLRAFGFGVGETDRSTWFVRG